MRGRGILMRFISLIFLILAFFVPAAHATEVFTADKDACASKDEKSFMAGRYVVIGQKDTGHAIPEAKDLYAAAAELKIEGCKMTVRRCENGVVETGTMERGVYMMEVPMWRASTGKRTWYLEMEGDKDNNAVLHGWGEFWRMDPDAQWSCK
jgi:hypothetical protein